jgi:hypothetical protein
MKNTFENSKRVSSAGFIGFRSAMNEKSIYQRRYLNLLGVTILNVINEIEHKSKKK